MLFQGDIKFTQVQGRGSWTVWPVPSVCCTDSPLDSRFSNDAAKPVYHQQNEITGHWYECARGDVVRSNKWHERGTLSNVSHGHAKLDNFRDPSIFAAPALYTIVLKLQLRKHSQWGDLGTHMVCVCPCVCLCVHKCICVHVCVCVCKLTGLYTQ